MKTVVTTEVPFTPLKVESIIENNPGDEEKVESEIIMIAYEKIDSLKTEIKEQNNIKKELMAKICKEGDLLEKNKDNIRKSEREIKKYNGEIIRLENDCMKCNDILNNLTENFEAFKRELHNEKNCLESQINDCNKRIKNEKEEFLREHNVQLSIEENLKQKRKEYELKIENITMTINELLEKVKIETEKQNNRAKKSKANFRTLETALNITK